MTGAPRFDLQSHSIHSDGELAAGDVVSLAANAGVELLALTDHDTVDGVEEAMQAAGRLGVRLVPAVELSTIDGEREDLHVLGYRVDHLDPEFLRLLADFRADRQRRIDAMAERLRELGFSLDDAELERRRAAGKPVGRPHLAQAVLAHPANQQRLSEENTATMDSFFPDYLVPGAAAYVPRQRPRVAEAIEAIHRVGGLAVWAHPFWDVDRADEVLAMIDRFERAGLDGVEVFYPTHSREQTELLWRRCEESGLLRTGSADFHGPGHARFAQFEAFELFGRAPVLGAIDG